MPDRPLLAQGNDVDRDRPHFFHRDYWTLWHIREGVLDFLAQHGQELRGAKALDFGAGQSPYAWRFAQTGVEWLAADIEPQAPGVLAISPDGRVPLPDGALAAVISTQVLEHVVDVQAYLAEAHRLLRPGGLLYLSTHGAFVLHRHPTDLRRWTVDGLRYDVARGGFDVLSVRPRIGILANATHLRSITIGGLTRRVPLTGWLRPVIYGFFNLRMWLEDAVTPASVMEAHPELITVIARKM